MLFPNRIFMNNNWIRDLGLKMPETLDEYLSSLKVPYIATLRESYNFV